VARHGQGVVNDYGSQRIYGIDAETGAELWKYKTTANIWNPPIVAGDSVYFLDQAGYPYRSFAVGELNGMTGNVSIKFSEGKDGVYPTYGDFVDIIGNRIVLMETASPRLVTVLDKDSGNVITTVDVSCTLRPSFSNGLMLLSESKCGWNYSHTQVFDLNTGTLLWAKEEGYSIGIGEIKVTGDKFIIKADDGLHGFSLKEGTKLWQLPVYDFINEEPNVGSQDGILLLKSLRGDSVLGLDTGSGQILWENDEVYSADKIIAQDLDAVFLLTESGEMLALDSKTGRKLWKFQSGTQISPVIFGENELIFGSTQVFVLDRQTGQLKQQPISVSDRVVAIYPKGELTFVEGENTLTVLTKGL
jgi:outer membrane protein assembly factor BamB